VLTSLQWRGYATLACAVLALSACGQGQQAVTNTARAAPVKAVAPAVVERPKADAASACAPAPSLALAQDFADPHHRFAPGTAPFLRLEASFAAAYRSACEHGILRGHPLIAAGATAPDRLQLKNAPDANVASIYLDGEEGAPPARRHMVLEYPLLATDGTTHLPSESELAEAIFCAVQGASQQEEEASGRCLPD
jgi:hypothetical protein